MAEFLTTTGISSELEKIIKGSQRGRLLLICPYLKFSRRIKELLEFQAKRWKTSIYIVYRKKPDLEETKWLDENSVYAFFRENLHTKCYMNDTHALVTSMNLHESSQVNNDEMGILVSVQDDPELYQEIRDEADHILRQSMAARKTSPARAVGQTAQPASGFCLRCASAIPFAPARPYCNSHYRSWARYQNKNEASKEKHCHACGEKHGASMAKPVCLSCYRKWPLVGTR